MALGTFGACFRSSNWPGCLTVGDLQIFQSLSPAERFTTDQRIDAALSQAGISGVEVYLRQQKVVLIALPDCREELQRAVDVVQHIEGVQLIDALIRDTTIFSDSAAKS